MKIIQISIIFIAMFVFPIQSNSAAEDCMNIQMQTTDVTLIVNKIESTISKSRDCKGNITLLRLLDSLSNSTSGTNELILLKYLNIYFIKYKLHHENDRFHHEVSIEFPLFDKILKSISVSNKDIAKATLSQHNSGIAAMIIKRMGYSLLQQRCNNSNKDSIQDVIDEVDETIDYNSLAFARFSPPYHFTFFRNSADVMEFAKNNIIELSDESTSK